MSIPQGGSGARSGSKRVSGARVSAGLTDTGADLRIAELEERLAKLEGDATLRLRERGRRMMDRVVPPEAGRHFRNAGREQLLGVRSILDFWLRRIEDAESRSRTDAGNGRETIEVD